VREFFARRRSRVTAEEEQVLLVASVAGIEFSSALVADALALDVTTVEERCEGLVRRRRFLRRAGVSVWPDGTEAARYGFEHALCQQLWHEQGALTRHQQWHRQLGVRLEQAYDGRAGEVATELAVHFEEGRDYPKAIQYHGLAAQQAGQRHAYQEGISHLTAALQLLKTLPATPERDQQELGLQWALHFQTVRLKGHAAPELQSLIARERALIANVRDAPGMPDSSLPVHHLYSAARFFCGASLCGTGAATSAAVARPIPAHSGGRNNGTSPLLYG
jgi:predicted ATPase